MPQKSNKPVFKISPYEIKDKIRSHPAWKKVRTRFIPNTWDVILLDKLELSFSIILDMEEHWNFPLENIFPVLLELEADHAFDPYDHISFIMSLAMTDFNADEPWALMKFDFIGSYDKVFRRDNSSVEILATKHWYINLRA